MSVRSISQITDTPYLTEFGEVVFGLQFDEEPNYSHLIFLLQKNLMNMDLNPGEIDVTFSVGGKQMSFGSVGEGTQDNISKESIENL